jgi:hypothetical protein
VVTSGPPIWISRSSGAARSAAAARKATASSIAIGWVRVVTQRGVTISGNRRTR